jgi:DNA-binding transcriptional ArsR family regulator
MDDDVHAVRALAHPLRLTLLDRLRFEGPSTATLLARQVGESTGSTSYHLRQLARHGFIEEAPRTDGRERWWKYRERRVSTQVGGNDRPRELLAELLSREAHALDGYLAEQPRSAEWDESAYFMSRGFVLTTAELAQVRDGIDALLAPLRRPADAGAPADARPVTLLALGFPLSLGQS